MGAFFGEMNKGKGFLFLAFCDKTDILTRGIFWVGFKFEGRTREVFFYETTVIIEISWQIQIRGSDRSDIFEKSMKREAPVFLRI